LNIVSKESWIIDGNSRLVGEIIWTRATVLIWLDFALPTVIRHVLTRTISRLASGSDFSGGMRESWMRTFFSRDSILLRSVKSWALWRREYKKCCSDWTALDLRVFRVNSRKQIDYVVQRLLTKTGFAAMYGGFTRSGTETRKQGVVHKSDLGWDLVLTFDPQGDPLLIFRANDMLMFDWDKVTEDECVTALDKLIHVMGRDALFRLYKTANGFHGFLVSEPRQARRFETTKWTTACHADIKYAWMSFARGHFDVRLSAKHENDRISDFVREVGTAQVDGRLSKVILCHDMLVDWSRDVGNSDWKKSEDADWFAMLSSICNGLAEAVAST
jgi:hypothetical protein